MRLESARINWNEIITGNDVESDGNDVESDWSWLKTFFEVTKNNIFLLKIQKLIKTNGSHKQLFYPEELKIRHGSCSKNLKMI